MKKISIILISLVCGLIIIPLTANAESAQRHRLPNGLTVILDENHEAPVVAIQVWVKAGSAYEQPGEEGITHVLEHMIFKGTPAHPAGEMGNRIESLGGEMNAYTSLDHTKYYVVAASRNAAEVLELLADAMANASFDEEELTREKEVIIEEMRMADDDPARRLSKQIMTLAFGKDHPYGKPVIGTEESVGNISRPALINYRNRLYHGPNMVVVVSGDFTATAMLPLLNQYFSGFSADPVPALALPEPVEAGQPQVVIMREEVQQATICLAWVIPGLPSLETYPLDVSAGIMGDGITSRLYWRLKEMQGVVDDVGAFSESYQGIGLLEMQASMAPDKVMSAWQPFVEEAISLIDQPAGKQELDKVRAGISAEYVRATQTMQGRANMRGYFELLHGGFEKAEDYIDRYRRVNPGQISATLSHYLVPVRLKMVIQLPKDAPAPDQAQVQAWANQVWQQATTRNIVRENTTLVRELKQGLTLVVVPRHTAPLVAMRLAVPYGQASEPMEQAGINQLWAGSVMRGNRQQNYEQIAVSLEAMAAGMDGFATRNMMGISASFLSDYWKEGLEMLAHSWQGPVFNQDEVDKARSQQLAALRAQMDVPVYKTFQALRALLYPGHPYGRDTLGSSASLARLNAPDLQKLHQRLQTTAGAILVVVGDVNPQEVLALVETLWDKQQRFSMKAESYPIAKLPDESQTSVINDATMQQLQILLGFRTPSITHPDTYTLELINAILGGQGGRLFADLREVQSLAYSVQPFYTPSALAGTFGVFMFTTPSKEQIALASIVQHLDDLCATPVGEEELQRAKNYLLGIDAIDQQTFGAQASTMARNHCLGLGYDYHEKFAAAINALTSRDVMRVAKQVFVGDRQVTIIYGP